MADEFDPVKAARAKYPALSGQTDQQILLNLAKPDNFRSTFPEYSSLDDDSIRGNMQQYLRGKLERQKAEKTPGAFDIAKETAFTGGISPDTFRKGLGFLTSAVSGIPIDFGSSEDVKSAVSRAEASGSPIKSYLGQLAGGILDDTTKLASFVTSPFGATTLASSTLGGPVGRAAAAAGGVGLGGSMLPGGAGPIDLLKSVPEAVGLKKQTVNPDEVQQSLFGLSGIVGGATGLKDVPGAKLVSGKVAEAARSHAALELQKLVKMKPRTFSSSTRPSKLVKNGGPGAVFLQKSNKIFSKNLRSFALKTEDAATATNAELLKTIEKSSKPVNVTESVDKIGKLMDDFPGQEKAILDSVLPSLRKLQKTDAGKFLLPKDAHELNGALKDLAKFKSENPAKSALGVRDIRIGLSNEINKVVPSYRGLATAENQLIRMQNSAGEALRQRMVGTSSDQSAAKVLAGHAIKGAVGATVGSLLFGRSSFSIAASSLASILLVKAWNATPSVTGRAALLRTAADFLDGGVKVVPRRGISGGAHAQKEPEIIPPTKPGTANAKSKAPIIESETTGVEPKPPLSLEGSTRLQLGSGTPSVSSPAKTKVSFPTNTKVVPKVGTELPFSEGNIVGRSNVIDGFRVKIEDGSVIDVASDAIQRKHGTGKLAKDTRAAERQDKSRKKAISEQPEVSSSAAVDVQLSLIDEMQEHFTAAFGGNGTAAYAEVLANSKKLGWTPSEVIEALTEKAEELSLKKPGGGL